jgi:putative transposase
MPRSPRWLQLTHDAAYHVMNRGHNRETVFTDDADRRYFLSLLQRYRQRDGFHLYHYCLMSNHFHLLLQLDNPKRLSSLMAGMLLAYVHYCHRRYGFVGHLWQGRFKSPLVQREDYWLSCGGYIERNPLEVGLCVVPWEYEWSSCRTYALGEANELLTENPCYTERCDTAAARQEWWRRFLMEEDPRQKVVERGDWAVGDVGFQQRMAVVLGRAMPQPRGRPKKGTAQPS